MRLQRRRVPSVRGSARSAYVWGAQGSRRSWALARVTSATVRPLTALIPMTDRGVRFSRRFVAGSLAVFSPVLPNTAVNRVEEAGTAGVRVRGEWVRAQDARRDDAVILYVHGSGYAVCSARTHRGLTSRLSAATGLPVFACDYRLAPRHRFPAAADDVRAAYEWLLARGYAPERVVLAGDSAGGHLAADLVCELGNAGRPVPAAMVLFSPLVDLTLGLAHGRERSARDPMISATRACRLVELYTRDIDAAHPRLALAPARGCAWPPTLVQAGGAEMLAADAEHLARAIRVAGGRCELELWPGQMHVFQAFARIVPEARRALTRAAEFVLAELPHAPDPAAVKETS